ncbi:phosphohydrolase [Desulfoluna limicola]|uniref:Phosphohydrolase n=1 Tax=Desulfoluna limicola TaxID=2810562 RepID=A0ABM7PNL0_9BACT|nr:HD domain-containing protein [Desulfoluna limicola]BCS98686.1 phosphohydrolase [Desulfoluna limicola]
MAELKAPAHLIEHVQLVWEAGAVLLKKCRQLGLDLDYSLVELGIAVHDLGKTVHTVELLGPGHRHEEEGQRILLSRGVSAEVAKVCVSHGQWERMACSTEELIVALSDKLWKGQRVDALELQVVDRICGMLNVDRWELFTDLDSCFEHIAADGQKRLNKSGGT